MVICCVVCGVWCSVVGWGHGMVCRAVLCCAGVWYGVVGWGHGMVCRAVLCWGVVWCGGMRAWCAVLCCAGVWYGVVGWGHGVPCCAVLGYGMVWWDEGMVCRAVLCWGMVWCGGTWEHGMVWCAVLCWGMVWCGGMRCGAVPAMWAGAVWCDVAQNDWTRFDEMWRWRVRLSCARSRLSPYSPVGNPFRYFVEVDLLVAVSFWSEFHGVFRWNGLVTQLNSFLAQEMNQSLPDESNLLFIPNAAEKSYWKAAPPRYFQHLCTGGNGRLNVPERMHAGEGFRPPPPPRPSLSSLPSPLFHGVWPVTRRALWPMCGPCCSLTANTVVCLFAFQTFISVSLNRPWGTLERGWASFSDCPFRYPAGNENLHCSLQHSPRRRWTAPLLGSSSDPAPPWTASFPPGRAISCLKTEQVHWSSHARRAFGCTCPTFQPWFG